MISNKVLKPSVVKVILMKKICRYTHIRVCMYVYMYTYINTIYMYTHNAQVQQNYIMSMSCKLCR